METNLYGQYQPHCLIDSLSPSLEKLARSGQIMEIDYDNMDKAIRDADLEVRRDCLDALSGRRKISEYWLKPVNMDDYNRNVERMRHIAMIGTTCPFEALLSFLRTYQLRYMSTIVASRANHKFI
jgi:hypothetical protein